MYSNNQSLAILIADDDEDDRLMTQEAIKEAKLLNDIYFVQDGDELMDYLYHRGRYADIKNSPDPGLILLDLNMPGKDGRQALREIKEDPELRKIPVIVLTASGEESDILHTYDLGVSSYIMKPVTFAGLAEVMRSLQIYWLNIVKLPA